MYSIQRFISEFEKIAPKFEWFVYKKRYKTNNLVTEQILGTKEGKEYIPLTALVEHVTGKYYDPSFFDKAAGEIFMSAAVATQILDACDEWPDRLHGYKPKKYETDLRQNIMKLCFGA